MDQREALIEAGLELAHARGFGATGVREIAVAAGVPQGSFTNHFRSKEAFGGLILDRYAKIIDDIMIETLGNDSLPPLQRLESYFERICTVAEGRAWRRSCLVADFASESSSYGDDLRSKLCDVIAQQSARFETVFRAIAGSADDEAADHAALALAAWHGTLMRMKVERNPSALNRFRRLLPHLLKAMRSHDA